MRRFELIDGERRDERVCADVWYDHVHDAFGATVRDWAGPLDVPAMFSPFAQRGERNIPCTWVRAWVDERIPPSSRQNIGEVLREHRLERYDPCELLAAGEGRSSQDGFYLREIGKPFRSGMEVGEAVVRARASAGMTQNELARRAGVRQEVISRIERGGGNPTVKTLERIARAFGKGLRVEFL